MKSDDSTLTLRDILRVVFKRKGMITWVTLVAIGGCAVVVFLMPPTYEAASQILVKRAMPETDEPTLPQNPRNAPTSLRQVNQADEMNTTISIIKSRDLVIAAIDRLELTRERVEKVPDFRRYVRGAYNGMRRGLSTAWNELKYALHLGRRPTAEELAMVARERLVDEVAGALVVEQVTDSDVVRVGFRCSDPVLAKEVANGLSAMTLTWHFDKYHQPGSLTFFRQQAGKAADTLRQTEKRLALLRNDLNLIGIEERKKLIIENRFLLQTKLNDIRARLAAGTAGIREIDRSLSAEPDMVTLSKETTANPLRHELSKKVADLELKRAEVLGKHTEKGRVVKDMDSTLKGWRSQLEGVEARRESAVVEGVNKVRQTMRQKRVTLVVELAALAAEKEVVREQIAGYDRDLRTINSRAYQIEDLERQARTQAATYEQYMKSEELVRVSEAKLSARIANLSIIQSAPVPFEPVSPRKYMYLLLAGAAGLLFAMAWAFAAEMTHRTLENEVQLGRELSVQALGTLPELKELRGAPLDICDPRRDRALLIFKRLFQQFERKEAISAGFTSSRRGEGTTTVALQTALAAAKCGRRVILVDADPEGGLTKRLATEGRRGLADLARGVPLDEVLCPTEAKRLSVIPAGSPGEEDCPADWSLLMQELRGRADVVFVDLPPALGAEIGPSVAAALDGFVLVVAAHETRREAARDARDELARQEGARLLGAVLSRRRFFIPEFIYRRV